MQSLDPCSNIRAIASIGLIRSGWGRYALLEATNTMERQTVSIMKACEMVGVSRRTIYNWIAAGKVEYVRTAGGSIRIFTDSLWRQPDGLRIVGADVGGLAVRRNSVRRLGHD